MQSIDIEKGMNLALELTSSFLRSLGKLTFKDKVLLITHF